MALIDYTYFQFPLDLDTSDELITQPVIARIIEFVENKYLDLISYETEDLESIEYMVGCFTFAYYTNEQLRVNTEFGNVDLKSDGTDKVYDTSYSLERYNDAIDILIEYATDDFKESEDYTKQTVYLNVLGI